jgi:cobalt-precorrin-5B (C1)-methyltransferase
VKDVEPKNKKLRSGYTTGACAAAAAKAATLLLVRLESGIRRAENILNVEIPFPDGGRVQFKVHHSELRTENSELISTASVIKDAGDDPDVTNGAEIRAAVSAKAGSLDPKIIIKGGLGVGIVTKPGLAIPVGEPAINPVPRKMITDAVREAVSECGVKNLRLTVAISVPEGEELAKKTLNHRLGIIGGISILGTTGIVKPLSDEAWTATVTSSMAVARAMGREEVVLSTGRTSEKAHQKKYDLPEESYVMMGDYTEFSLREAKQHGFKKIHLCAQWAKMIKVALATPQTHVRHGALDVGLAAEFLRSLGYGTLLAGRRFNTAREMYVHIYSEIGNRDAGIFVALCLAARNYCEKITMGVSVITHLVSYEGEIVASAE